MNVKGWVRLLGGFAVAFAALSALWPLAAPFYNAAVFTAADAVLTLDDPVVARLAPSEARWTAFRIDGTQQTPIFAFDTVGTFFNVVLLLALLGVAPGLNGSQRAARAGLGLALLALSQVGFIWVETKAQFVNLGLVVIPANEAYLYNWAAVLLGTLGEQLIPLAIVATLSWRGWLQRVTKTSNHHGVSTPRAAGAIRTRSRTNT